MADVGQDKTPRPTYAAAFRCVGPECEDHCCREWDIPLDRVTYEAYRNFPRGRLGEVVSEFVILNEPGSPPGMYAYIGRRASGECSFLGSDRLCGIQKEYGPSLLSATCSIYPRYLSKVEGLLEGTLSLSCPEAARQVLLDPEFALVQGDLEAGAFRTDNFYLLEPTTPGAEYKPYRWFEPIRQTVLALIADRGRPLWQRVFLIGILCMRLQEVTPATESGAVPAILREYEQIIAQGSLLDDLERMAGQPAVRLDVVRALLEERIKDEPEGSRFVETWRECTSGAGGAAALLDAEQRFYLPWTRSHPHFLENYLKNYVLQNLSPFGREGSAQSAPQSIAAEFLLMATQFACVEVLLMGVAGYLRGEFSGADAVRAVQTFTRTIDHYPEVRRRMVNYVTARGLSGLDGVVVLLKN